MNFAKNALLCIIFLLVCRTNNAQIIHIPDDEPSIQMGIEAANDGDTVLVAHGTYYENLDFLGKEITVASHYLLDQDFSHIILTKIDGSQPANINENSLVYFRSGEDTTSILCGLTLTNGSGTEAYWGDRAGGAIYCDNSSAKIIHNRIINNHVYEYEECAIGGAIYAHDSTGHTLIIKNNIINNNTAMSTALFAVGGALFISMAGIINHNDICDNLADGMGYNWGGGVNLTGQFFGELCYNNIEDNTLRNGNTFGAGVIAYAHINTVKILHNSVIGNTCEGTRSLGGGFYFDVLDEVDIIMIEGNIVKNNIAYYGAGMRIAGPASSPISNNIFDGNEAYACGGGLYIEWGGKSSVFPYAKGHRTEPKTDIYSKSENMYQIINNTFVNNTAWLEGGGGFGCNLEYNDLLAFNNIFYGNSDPITTGNSIANIYITNNNIDTSEISGTWTGKDNIYSDPEFVDDSCHIATWSCCVNAGVASIDIGFMTYEAPDSDIDRDTRPDNLYNIFDIGADENNNVGVGLPHNSELGLEFDGITLFPNPCRDKLNISFDDSSIGEVTLNIYTIGGKLVKTSMIEQDKADYGSISLSVGDLTPGLYIVNIENIGISLNKKVLIKP